MIRGQDVMKVFEKDGKIKADVSHSSMPEYFALNCQLPLKKTATDHLKA